MAIGIIIGYVFKNRSLSWSSVVVKYVVYILLFSLGLSVGANDNVMSNLGVIAADAIVITLFAVLGSVLFAKIVYKYMLKHNKNEE